VYDLTRQNSPYAKYEYNLKGEDQRE